MWWKHRNFMFELFRRHQSNRQTDKVVPITSAPWTPTPVEAEVNSAHTESSLRLERPWKFSSKHHISMSIRPRRSNKDCHTRRTSLPNQSHSANSNFSNWRRELHKKCEPSISLASKTSTWRWPDSTDTCTDWPLLKTYKKLLLSDVRYCAATRFLLVFHNLRT